MTPNASVQAGEASTEWADESAQLYSDLIWLDSQFQSSHERLAAQFVGAHLADMGIESALGEPAHRGSSLNARVRGACPSLGPWFIHAHLGTLDVVRADPSEWTVDPVAGEIEDRSVWGPGAVDTKDGGATRLTVDGHRMATSFPPKRPIVASLADEESAGVLDAERLVRERPELFQGCRRAVDEGGGWTTWVGTDWPIYAIHTAEKGSAAVQVTAHRAPGCTSGINDDNAVRVLAEAIGRPTSERFPLHLTAGIESMLRTACAVLGLTFRPTDPERCAPVPVPGLRWDERVLSSERRHTAPPHSGIGRISEQGHFEHGQGRPSLSESAGLVGGVRRRTPCCPGRKGRDQHARPKVGFGSFIVGCEQWHLGGRAVCSPGRRSGSPRRTLPDPGGLNATHYQRLNIECFRLIAVLLQRILHLRLGSTASTNVHPRKE